VMLAYAVIVALMRYFSVRRVPGLAHVRWQRSPALSLAGWWHALVSPAAATRPVLRLLWRLVPLGTGFLWRMSRLDLLLIPAHPDTRRG